VIDSERQLPGKIVDEKVMGALQVKQLKPNTNWTSNRVHKQLQNIGDLVGKYAERNQCRNSILCKFITSVHKAQCATQQTVLLTPLVVVVVYARVLTQHLNKVIDSILIRWQALNLPDQP
jgi:hypothetical protein